MNRVLAILKLTLLVLVGFLVACQSGEIDGMNQKIAQETRELIERELEPGASRSDVEAFLERHSIEFAFDRHTSRIQAIIRDVAENPDIDQAVLIHLYFDEDGKFVGAEVKDSFTSL